MENPHGPISNAANKFEAFIEIYDTMQEPSDRSGKYLQTYLVGWLKCGDGLVATGHSPMTYLRTALEIADRAIRGEIRFDFGGTVEGAYENGYPRKVEALHEPGSTCSHYADPALYEQIASSVAKHGLDEPA
jgi:hypothetical protein